MCMEHASIEDEFHQILSTVLLIIIIQWIWIFFPLAAILYTSCCAELLLAHLSENNTIGLILE